MSKIGTRQRAGLSQKTARTTGRNMAYLRELKSTKKPRQQTLASLPIITARRLLDFKQLLLRFFLYSLPFRQCPPGQFGNTAHDLPGSSLQVGRGLDQFSEADYC